MPACKVQIPSRSEASTSEANSFVPTPWPRDCRATYTLTSATPEYAHLLETGLRAAHPSTPFPERATSLQARRWPASQDAHSGRSEEHTSELQSQFHLVCRLLLEKKKKKTYTAGREKKNKKRKKCREKTGRF